MVIEITTSEKAMGMPWPFMVVHKRKMQTVEQPVRAHHLLLVWWLHLFLVGWLPGHSAPTPSTLLPSPSHPWNPALSFIHPPINFLSFSMCLYDNKRKENHSEMREGGDELTAARRSEVAARDLTPLRQPSKTHKLSTFRTNQSSSIFVWLDLEIKPKKYHKEMIFLAASCQNLLQEIRILHPSWNPKNQHPCHLYPSSWTSIYQQY